jgi:hypothetical protein
MELTDEESDFTDEDEENDIDPQRLKDIEEARLKVDNKILKNPPSK